MKTNRSTSVLYSNWFQPVLQSLFVSFQIWKRKFHATVLITFCMPRNHVVDVVMQLLIIRKNAFKHQLLITFLFALARHLTTENYFANFKDRNNFSFVRFHYSLPCYSRLWQSIVSFTKGIVGIFTTLNLPALNVHPFRD